MQPIPSPNPRDLLPPLLACLPTAFTSARPPPALLPLLSPILRQRVQLLTANSNSSDSWLTLLSWDASRASKLPSIAENMNLEPHPVSGEIELEDVDDLLFRRLDQETLHTRIDLEEFELCAIYLWCTGDEAGGGDGWRLAELRAFEDKEDGTEWFSSLAEAEEASGAHTSRPTGHSTAPATNATQPEQEDDDDDYWAAYDRTPGRTPAKHSPAPRSTANSRVQLGPTNDELEYFARYASEVQPALDAHDADEEVPDAPPSTLNGNSFGSVAAQSTTDPTPPRSAGAEELSKDEASQGFSTMPTLSQPRPRSPGESSIGSVDKLERQADRQSQTETAIKQHIGTDIKSLFRLARSVGMDREEFERVVKTELELLSMMENDD